MRPQATRGRRAMLFRPLFTILALLLLWTGGFIHFVRALPDQLAKPVAEHDAIVVLTGGPLRLAAGVELLQQGVARRLFISGVNAGVTAAMLPGHADHTDLFECCVELGYAARDTAGNAVETAQWATRSGAARLVIVTAAWHLPRAMVELRRRLPDAMLTPWPVFTERAPPASWWRSPATLAVLAPEFTKYFAALVRARGQELIGMGGST